MYLCVFGVAIPRIVSDKRARLPMSGGDQVLKTKSRPYAIASIRFAGEFVAGGVELCQLQFSFGGRPVYSVTLSRQFWFANFVSECDKPSRVCPSGKRA